ncbi:ABC transporter ATP-binding protein [Candidatus Woesearchaeota archaeon]|nr:ABC transporter ATP-binding protein [Candidatus Woesearchaeota archaeon]
MRGERVQKFRRFLHKTARIMRYAKPQWKLCVWLFILTGFLSLLSLVGPYMVKILLDDVIPSKNLGLLFNLIAIFIIIFVVKGLLAIYHSYQTTQFVENLIFDVKTQLFSHIENLDMSFFHSKKVGDMLYRLDEDVYSMDDVLNIVVNVILLESLTAIFILIICLKLNWQITLASLGFFPFYLIAQHYFSEKINRQKEKLVQKSSDLLSFLEENLSSMAAIKAFVLEALKLREFQRKSKKLIHLDLKMDLLESSSSTVVALITFIPLLLILWFGSVKVMAGVLTIGSLIAIYTYISKLFEPIATLGSVNVGLQSALVSVDRVFAVIDTKAKIHDKPNAAELHHVKGDISFKNVAFSYNHDEPILQNINLHIQSGEIIGLVGPSGAGKTTIGNLICRFFDPQKGNILLDGLDLRDIQLFSLRKNIGIVSQEAILFNTTIKENIRFGNMVATDEDIIQAAKLANMHDFIMGLEKGYNTPVGERGVRLSGGEKQRISIARVLLRNPPILILDEPTSALDAISEAKVQKALEYATKGRTVLIIAHRLSTIRHVDKIFVIKDGRIVEEGPFTTLMRKHGAFYTYYNKQFGTEKRSARAVSQRAVA